MVAPQVAAYVNDLWKSYQNSTTFFRQKLLDYYKQYRGIPNRKNYEGLANVFVNETLEACESIVAQEIHTLFAEPNYLLVQGRETTDENKARLIESLMGYYLDAMNFKSKIIRQVRQKNKYGTTIARVCWCYEEKEITQRTKEGISQSSKATKDHPDLDFIDLLDVAVDPGKPDIDKMDWVIIRKRCSWDYIIARASRGVYSMKQVEKMNKSDKSQSSVLDNKRNRMWSVGINYQAFNTEEYEILEMWGKLPKWMVDDMSLDDPKAHDMTECVVEVALNGVTLRCERNPYWHQEKPFVMGHFIQVDDEAFGIGVCEITESLQQELNDKRNQLLDHATETIAPPLIKNRNANIKKEQIKLGPFQIIDSDLAGESALTPLRLGGNPLENVQMDSIIKQDIRNETGATNPIQGISASNRSTAYEVSQLQSRGSARIDISTVDFSEKFIKRCYKLMYSMVQQYLTKEKAVRIAGKEGIRWEKVTPEDLMLDVDLIPKVSTDVDNRSIMRNQLIQFITGIASFYPRINIYRLVKKIYTLFGFEDADEVIPEPDTERGVHELTIEQEIQVLAMGQRIEVKYWEDHLTKIQALMGFLSKYEGQLPPKGVEAVKDALNQHVNYLKLLESLQANLGQGAPPGNGATPQSAGPATPVAQSAQAQRDLTGGLHG